ncbi:MAG TPA: response regulator transcription factor [Lachnospiraceae bacterium]|nr:response regulator transcription factor [Lachnospiraceae bacterium]
MINIMIVDDHAMIREGLKSLIEFDGRIKVVAEAKDGEECLSVLSDISPDVLLLDINMPNMNGIEVLKVIIKKKIKVKVLILTLHDEVEYLVNAIENGAQGFILKDSPSSELINAIEVIHFGGEYIQPDLIPKLNATLINKNLDQEKINLLTKREVEVLVAIANGNFNKDIASNLNISERTVKNHISNIFKKIDVKDRTQAAVFAIKNNLVRLF